ncbi:MAG: sigma 54-interacting transcriptional regulator [Desulfofustis sp.]|jgi:PAS domain S-box-containing protein|nr:sigma 54-interacting transcriptional regulator [Desulfofustis sp.]
MIGRELDGYWKTVVNTIRDGIMIINTSGAIVSVNKAFEQITGYSREELIGEHCSILDNDLDDNAPKYSDFQTDSGDPQHESDQHQCLVKRKDGSRIHTLKTTAILRDGDGNALGRVGTITDLTEIVEKDNQLEAYRRQLQAQNDFHGIVGTSPAMQQVFDLIENAAYSDAPVIIYGESGTGKELVSRAIHEIGARKDKPFVKVNCASLTESLLESELFGHVRGAYTGAYKDRIGRFEKATGGDLFLDEIGDLPMSTQIKLLRVLEEKVIERVGSSTPINTDVRIISATNQNLPKLVEQGRFRNDFYFRINVIPIFLPPLRERSQDIPLLVESFFRILSVKSSKTIDGIHGDTMELMMNYRWPGNIRELRAALEYAFVTCHSGPIHPSHLPETISRKHPRLPPPSKKGGFNLYEIERQELIDALERAKGNQSRAAKLLGVSRVTVWNRMKRFNLKAKKDIVTSR